MILGLALAMAIMVISFPVQAQLGSYQLSKINFTSGPGPLSSGLDLTVKLSDGNKTIQFTANDSRITLAHQWDLGLPSVAITGGFFHNTPWIGPRVVLDWSSHVSTMHWIGWSASNPNDPVTKWQPDYIFGWNSVTITVGKLDITYGASSYLKDQLCTFPGLGYTLQLGSNVTAYPSVNWDVRNDNLMYQVGLSWTPKK
ncbi:MAG: hypothetical protein V1846_04100 [Candidatus Komeilibacteria bacterium]